MKNAEYRCNDVKRVCENKLHIPFRSGKELNGWFVLEGKKTARITVPKGRKDIPPGTYRSMARQLFLTVAQFDELLDCPMNLKKYVKIITEREQNPSGR
jgi:hypothetical protein